MERRAQEESRDLRSDRERRLLVHCLVAAARAIRPEESVARLLPYLECFPLGAFNRYVAQRVEDLLTARGLAPAARDALRARFRGLRDPLLPEIDELI